MHNTVITFFTSHFEIFMFAVFHFCSQLFYSFLEYKIGIDKNVPENSYMEILINRLKGVKK